ncbi:hypothetical protein TanjilG_22622 [Lupinus angustifolius]|uniref:Uncharacterized protein n=1 Tax=Lupinus angustifolius TaxID=3871 RepID=A0A4P1RSE2_LUPAN|nr:hypothetical protein TanjilG_22622 [Lupinus angustifolius]
MKLGESVIVSVSYHLWVSSPRDPTTRRGTAKSEKRIDKRKTNVPHFLDEHYTRYTKKYYQ